MPAAVDVALTLALLATFAAVAFVKKGTARLDADGPGPTEVE
jgi:multicomponent Na+:H+ antiporter subunit F